jgi:hypothetical protein
MSRNTVVSIEGQEFRINGKATYEGRSYQGRRIEGLLLNSRMVQGVFDDRNEETRPQWNYPDGPWDPERNTREFLSAMPLWRSKGLLAFTICFQGGNPRGYGGNQIWHNSAFESDGTLRDDYAGRMARIIDRADELGMVVILGLFYFGQDQRFDDEAAVIRAADNATDWLLKHGWTNVIIEVGNEVDNGAWTYDIIKAGRGDELIRRIAERSEGKVDAPGGRLLVSTSMCGGAIPPENLVEASDFLLIHGNGVGEPGRIREMVDQCRALSTYRGQPIVFNEDDHFDFEQEDNNFLASLDRYASWGLFDYRMTDEGYDEGYQSVPANWGISSDRKRGFFDLLAKVTGSE